MIVDIRIIRRRKRLLRQTAEQSHILLCLCYLFGRKAVADVIFTAVQLVLSDLFSDAHPAFTREINADVSDKVHTCFVGRSYLKHRIICRLRRIQFYIVVDKEVVR